MSTFVEIEAAVEALPAQQQATLLNWLTERLRDQSLKGDWKWPLLPPIGFPITQQEIDDAIDEE